jgi:DNA-binding transcriptional regulator YiaG
MTETLNDLRALARVRALVRSGTARSVRLASDLGVSEMARAAGVSDRSIYRWERGITVPQGPAALRYGRLLDELLRGDR